MKQNILRVICALLLVGALGLYVYGIVAKGESPTDNLPRTVVIVISAISALMKLTPKRRPLSFYANAYAKELGSAFQEDPAKREKLLEALRLYNEDKISAAIKALEALRPAAASRDARYAVEVFIALCQTDLGVYEEAIDTYEGMIASGLATSQVYSNLSYCHQAIHEMDKAGEAGLMALKLDPENARAHVNVGNILLEAGKYDLADEAAARATELAPDMQQGWTQLAITRAILGDEEGWKKASQQAVKHGQDAKKLAQAIARYVEKAKAAE